MGGERSGRPVNGTAEFSLPRFEQFAHARDREDAATELVRLLRYLDWSYGRFGSLGDAPTGEPASEQRDSYFSARISAALAALFADPAATLSDEGFDRLVTQHHWFSTIFGASAFGHADHVIELLNQARDDSPRRFVFRERDLLKVCLLYSLDSEIPIVLDVLWQKSRRLAATFGLALLSSRLVATPPAQEKREALLEWLTPRLAELSFEELPLELLHAAWMLCSYADRPGKHAIKRSINRLARNKLLASGIADLDAAPPRREKPVILCLLEGFHSNHSIYRTHSRSLEALRRSYRLVGVLCSAACDDISRQVFDEVYEFPRAQDALDTARDVRELARRLTPDIVYYPSLGMFTYTVLLCNLRLAPLQMMALGHPATTHSPYIDYVLAEEDYIGDPKCFSERLVALPPEAIPYRPPAHDPSVPPKIRKSPDPVRIAVAASLLKINAPFLSILRRIAIESKVRVEFHVFSAANGLEKVYLQNVVQRVLPGSAVVYPNLPYEPYLQGINSCDMFVNPFPFGNTNGLVNTIHQGLPGVCLTGAEVHSHIDEGLFRRFGLPEWMIARTPDEYVAAAVRLAQNHAEREELSRTIQKTNPDKILFEGNPELFAEAVRWLHSTHAEHAALGPGSLLRPPVVRPRPQKGETKSRKAPAKVK